MPIAPRPAPCRACPLDPIAIGFQPKPEGSGANGVAIYLEALGEHEANESLPARPHAPTGAILERTITRAGFNRQQFMVSNCVRCRPGLRNLLEHQPYEFGALSQCHELYTIREIQDYKPKVILACGNVPLRQFTGFTGKKRQITNVRGFYLDNLKFPGIPVIGTYHPAFISRDKPNLLGVLRTDMLRAVALAKAGGKFERPSQAGWKLFPPIEAARRWVEELRREPELLISYDIETVESILGTDESELRALGGGRVEWSKPKPEYVDVPEHLIPPEEDVVDHTEITTTRITQIQFSARIGEAQVWPFENGFIQLAREVMALPNPKIGHNSRGFDLPILRDAQIHANGILHDSLLVWHHLQADLPRGLQYVTSFFVPEAEPWKHISDSDPGPYGAMDVVYLRDFGPTMLQQLRDRGLWEGYDRRVRQLESILTTATGRGIPVNEEKRQALRVEAVAARAELDREIQGLVPDSLRNCEPKEGYCNPTQAKAAKLKPMEEGERWIEREFDAQVLLKRATKTEKSVYEMQHVKRWTRLQPFLPNSSQQILKWIKWRQGTDVQARVSGYRAQPRYASLKQAELEAMALRNSLWQIPKAFRTDKETTAKKELERLGKKTGDPFLAMNIQHREYGKLIATYVDGWAPGPDGAVHGTFTFTPATAQLGAVRPNVLNPMKHGRLAKPFRRMIEAKPGHVLIECDATAFHARTLGLAAQDPAYMRLAALDIHSFVAAHMLRLAGRDMLLDLPDSELKARLKFLRADTQTLYNGLPFEIIRNEKAKRAILGIGFGLGAKKLYDMNMESFANLAEAKKLQDLLKGLFPKIFQFQNKVRELAHKQGFLKNKFGFMRWFWDVYHWDGKKQMQVPGADSEAAIAYLPASHAFGMIRETILRLESRGLCERFGFINTIHDSLMFHCRRERAEECVGEVLVEMEAPSLELADPLVAPNGFSCGAEASWGENWAEMKDVKWDRKRKGVAA